MKRPNDEDEAVESPRRPPKRTVRHTHIRCSPPQAKERAPVADLELSFKNPNYEKKGAAARYSQSLDFSLLRFTVELRTCRYPGFTRKTLKTLHCQHVSYEYLCHPLKLFQTRTSKLLLLWNPSRSSVISPVLKHLTRTQEQASDSPTLRPSSSFAPSSSAMRKYKPTYRFAKVYRLVADVRRWEALKPQLCNLLYPWIAINTIQRRQNRWGYSHLLYDDWYSLFQG